MNKLICIALAALVSVALASPVPEVDDEATQFAFFEDDQTETKSLSPERQIFSDFCLQARDEVKAHIKENINKGASLLFKGASEEILNSAAQINQQQHAAIERGQQLIKEDARNAAQATGNVFSSLVDGVKNGVYEKVEQIKSQFTRDNFRQQVYDGCEDIIKNIRPKVEAKLEETKSELSQSASDEATKSLIEATTLENVGCIMTGRVNRLSRSCEKLVKIDQETLASFGM